MNKLENLKLIKNRIAKVASTPPVKPLNGLGFDRFECKLERVFAKIEKLAPSHCERISTRGAINPYGKIGFFRVCYLSPEMTRVILANQSDFEALEKALALVEEVGL